MKKNSGKDIGAAKPDRRTKSAAPLAPQLEQTDRTVDFPIVAIGASAGGLEAVTLFLGQVPKDSGLAFVIIQHLDPTYVGMFPELLQRITSMEVQQTKDRTKVKPDCVYVIPPNKDMSILHGVLHLFEPNESRGLRLPIDFFFRSLAEDCRERSIGVILSGMGSDGTLGLRAIKEKGGFVLVQDPATAKFSGMPSSAIGFGLADVVAKVEELPGKIMAYLKHFPPNNKMKTVIEDKELSALEKIVILLRDQTGNDFSLYKKSTLYRRIERRMGIHQIDTIATYVRYLQANTQELELLFQELLIGVTNFFRDPPAWEKLQSEIIPRLLADHPEKGVLRAWSVGCSTGEEAFSLAIVFKEAQEQVDHKAPITLQIFATDLDRDAISKARQGLFPLNIAADVSVERLNRFFVKEETGYRIRKEIRDMVTFAVQNVISDAPFTRLDILICRNLLIYLDVETQAKLLPLFRYALNPSGVLFLGSAETLSSSAELFTPINGKLRLFKCDKSAGHQNFISLPSSFFPIMSETYKDPTLVKSDNLQALAEKLLLQKYSPPAVLVNDKGDIIYTSARTGKYLEPTVGKANLNIFAMARDGLRRDLYSAFQKALDQTEPVIQRNLVVGTNGEKQTIDLIIQKLEDPELRRIVMVIFKDVTASTLPVSKRRSSKSVSTESARIAELELEIQKAREDLQASYEEMQTSQEELKASNEELQSVNEELQSTNEELTTSKEELQSLNEELQTVNAEQQAKVDELSHLNEDMMNLLNSTEIATIFLDKQRCLRRFTPGVNKVFKLIPGDVGRPLSDIVNDLIYLEFPEDVDEVLRTLRRVEKQIESSKGQWFLLRIMPYRTLADVIDGVVITLSDITATKKLEEELREVIRRNPQADKK
ncbi:MAG: chemotaxis protein CheB [Geobacter sp.]|nr:MAG: chemotaxis protein CheB [Geobacter sp.]